MSTPDDFEIYKIQRPLAGNGPAEALVYNRGKRDLFQLPLDRPLRRLFRESGNPPKLYVRARMNGLTFEIDAVVAEEAW